MKKILFISALPLELKAVKESVKNLKLEGIKTDFFCTGMGNYETIFSLTKFLKEKEGEFDFVVNIGVCGKSGSKDLDSFQVGRIFNLMNGKELVVPSFFSFGALQSIACSEAPVFDSKVLQGENFVEMESYGVEFVLSRFQIPRIILKVPVDKIGEETKSFDKEKALGFLKDKIDYKKLLEEIKKYLEVVNRNACLLQYKEFLTGFKFTTSEERIFENYFHAYKALSGQSFEIFFNENKNLDKKAFLKKLQEEIAKLRELD